MTLLDSKDNKIECARFALCWCSHFVKSWQSICVEEKWSNRCQKHQQHVTGCSRATVAIQGKALAPKTKKACALLVLELRGSMNVDAILSYKSDPAEDYYGLLGCDSSASTEQIVAEFKARAKDCHPDKNKPDSSSREKFQQLLRVSKLPQLNSVPCSNEIPLQKGKRGLS
jgi:hypothetical protein